MKLNFQIDKRCFNQNVRFMFDPEYTPKKYNIFYGGTGSGKSYSLYQLFTLQCLMNKGTNILQLRKVGSTLQNTCIKPWLEVIESVGLLKDTHYTYNKTEKELKFFNGSMIRWSGYDDPEKVKGIAGVNILWMEECTDFTQDDFEDITDRLRSLPPKGHSWFKENQELKIFLSFNPIYKHHWIRGYFFEDLIDTSQEIHRDVVKDNELIFALKSTWRDNRFYNGKYKNDKIREKTKKINYRKYSVQCNGNWGVLGELIYERNFKIIDASKNEKDYDYIISYGLDFGWSHKFAIAKLAFKDNDIYVLGEIYHDKTGFSQMAKLSLSKFKTSSWYDMYCDSARPEGVAELVKCGITRAKSCTKGQNSVLEGIEWLQDRMIYIDKNCHNVIDEINSYQWQKDKKTGQRILKPVKENDELMDAIRYGCEPWRIAIRETNVIL